MFLKENNVVIRNALVSDTATLSKWWADGKVMAHAGFPNGLKTDELKLAHRIILQNEQSLPNNQLMIIELINKYPIGEMNYQEQSKDVYEIGIKICVLNEQGNGYGTTAINLLIAFLRDELKAKKIILDTNLTNIGAQRFYKRLGFNQTSIKEDCWIDQMGNLQSAVFFEMLL
ncbi:MAG: GNAT family N-acetyltransferase [Firmicutes bacterium]|nr:GNAT family N-acetyltransferase [Bacillota bacterium]